MLDRLSIHPALRSLSAGSAAVVALAIISSAIVIARGDGRPETEATMWTFAAPHFDIYKPVLDERNQTAGFRVDLINIGRQVMDRRMLGGFLGGVPTADLLEAERSTASLAFAGPLEAVGFLDITDRLEAEGLFDEIVPAAFSPWTFEGRVFGIPHDVHPVMLGYRADLVDAAGIDLSRVETWDELFAALEPLRQDLDGDGTIDRFPMSLWHTNSDMIETMLLQGGGGAFAADGSLAIDRPINADMVARMVSWMVGPGQVAADVPEFNPAGTQQKLEGRAVAYLMPDWMCNIWRRELPQLHGKVRLMPLPAWEPGGRRTSVWGGAMLGIAKAADNHDELWEFAKFLYLSDDLARELYRTGDIVTPVRSLWDDPIFDEPDPYFSGQRKGRMYIELADDVPLRAASPFFTQARMEVLNAVSRLHGYAADNGVYTADGLRPIAADYLRDAHRDVQRIIDRNAFHGGSVAAGAAGGAGP
ncbi:MAG: ABC transporter substrate-binding protein [Planctomycetota bacterium]